MGWKKEHGGHIPHHAVLAGYDKDGSPLYVGRAHHRGDVIPGKISPSHRVLYIPYGGKEHHVSHYEVLKNSAKYHWMRSRNGQREPGSLKGGKQSDGTKLYIGRTTMGGVTVIGKVHPGHGCLYVPYNGDEHKVYEYEILVKRRYHPTLPSHPPPYLPPSVPFPGQPHVPSGPFPGQHPPGPGIYPPLGPVYPPGSQYPPGPHHSPHHHHHHDHHHRPHHHGGHGFGLHRSKDRRRNSSSSSSSSD